MQIKTEYYKTGNIINFYPDGKFLSRPEVLLYKNSTKDIPEFVQNILNISGIILCLIGENIVSVKYDDESFTDESTSLIMAEIDDFFNEGQTINTYEQKNDMEKIEAIADTFIRPTLDRDNGNIEICSFNKGILKIKFTGHCSCCPYAQNTLNNLIVRIYKKYVSEILNVEVGE